MVSTPVGMKCRDCATSKGTAHFKVSPLRLVLAAITALVAGVGAALVGNLGFFVIFVGTAYGYFAGNVIMKAAGMKRGLILEIVAGAGIVIGALAFRFLPMILLGKHPSMGMFLNPFFWIGVVLASACAVSKIRYL
jgi:hypothetical protein